MRILIASLLLLFSVNAWAAHNFGNIFVEGGLFVEGTVAAESVTYDDFTDFTEVDANSDITVNSATLMTLSTVIRSAETYVYIDAGAGEITDFTGEIQVDPSGGGATEQYGRVAVYGWSDAINDISGWSDGVFIRSRATSTTVQVMELHDVTGGLLDTSINLNYNDQYLSIDRTGTTTTVEIYSDASRTSLTDTISGTTTGTALRYLYVLACDVDLGGSTVWAGTIENMDYTSK